jgi:hypothetical protein
VPTAPSNNLVIERGSLSFLSDLPLFNSSAPVASGHISSLAESPSSPSSAFLGHIASADNFGLSPNSPIADHSFPDNDVSPDRNDVFFTRDFSSHHVDLDSVSLDSFIAIMLPIEHNPDFINIGSCLILGEDSDSDELSRDDDKCQNHVYDDDIHVPVLDINDVTGFPASIHLDSSRPINPSSLHVADEALLALPYARGQACKRESMLKGSKFGEIIN